MCGGGLSVGGRVEKLLFLKSVMPCITSHTLSIATMQNKNTFRYNTHANALNTVQYAEGCVHSCDLTHMQTH